VSCSITSHKVNKDLNSFFLCQVLVKLWTNLYILAHMPHALRYGSKIDCFLNAFVVEMIKLIWTFHGQTIHGRTFQRRRFHGQKFHGQDVSFPDVSGPDKSVTGRFVGLTIKS